MHQAFYFPFLHLYLALLSFTEPPLVLSPDNVINGDNHSLLYAGSFLPCHSLLLKKRRLRF